MNAVLTLEFFCEQFSLKVNKDSNFYISSQPRRKLFDVLTSNHPTHSQFFFIKKRVWRLGRFP